jgi:seryl-tRNA synthetase
MEFEALIEIVFNKDIESSAAEVKKAVDSAAPLLVKGAKEPSEGTYVVSADAKKDVLVLKMKSGALVRVHAALIRLRNHLNKELGKTLKIGTREIRVKEYKVHNIPLKREPLQPVRIAHFVNNIGVKKGAVDLELKDITQEMLEDGSIDRLINLVNDKIDAQHYEGREEVKQLLYEGKQKKMLYDKDPAIELEKLGWMRRTAGKGQFIYTANFVALVNVFKSIIKEKVYDTLSFNEYFFPKFEPWEVPSRSGHAKSIYPNAYFVFVPKLSDPKAFESETDYFRITGKVLTSELSGKLESVGILSYAQCPPLWPYFEGRTIVNESLPIKVYDWSGPTYRNEAGGTQGITRIEEFHRIETLWIGTPEQVKEIAMALDTVMQDILENVLDLEIKRYRVTPWFLAQEGKKDLSDKSDIGVGTIDYDAYIPFRGPKDKAEWLEIMNISVNGDKYPVGFSVKTQKGELWSGCSGIGLERWVATFLSQKGLDPANWPEEIRKRFKPVEDIKFA